MRHDGRIVFRHLDGSVELYGPGCPVQGTYRNVASDEALTVAELGNGITESSSRTIMMLDQQVADGAWTFTSSETEAEYWQRIHDRTKAAVPHLAGAEWVATIPSAEHVGKDRYFRAAWTWSTPEPVIDVDMPKAIEIHKNKLRELRAPKLAALDVAYQKADEAGDVAEKKNVAGQKQALRDVTADPRITSALTPEELKSVIPEVLK